MDLEEGEGKDEQVRCPLALWGNGPVGPLGMEALLQRSTGPQSE